MSAEDSFRVVQGALTMVGGVLVAASVWWPTLFDGYSTIEIGMAALALGFLSATGAAFAADESLQGVLSLVASGLFAVAALDADGLGVVGGVALSMVGVLFVVRSLDASKLRERFAN